MFTKAHVLVLEHMHQFAPMYLIQLMQRAYYASQNGKCLRAFDERMRDAAAIKITRYTNCTNVATRKQMHPRATSSS